MKYINRAESEGKEKEKGKLDKRRKINEVIERGIKGGSGIEKEGKGERELEKEEKELTCQAEKEEKERSERMEEREGAEPEGREEMEKKKNA